MCVGGGYETSADGVACFLAQLLRECGVDSGVNDGESGHVF